MTPSNDVRTIEKKLKELSALIEQREQTQSRVTKTEAVIRAFIELLEDDVDQRIYTARLAAANKPHGITGAVKNSLTATGKKLVTPIEVRDDLQKSGFPLSGYSNALAVVYTTLKRLCEQGFAEKIEGKCRMKASTPKSSGSGMPSDKEMKELLAQVAKKGRVRKK